MSHRHTYKHTHTHKAANQTLEFNLSRYHPDVMIDKKRCLINSPALPRYNGTCSASSVGFLKNPGYATLYLRYKTRVKPTQYVTTVLPRHDYSS